MPRGCALMVVGVAVLGCTRSSGHALDAGATPVASEPAEQAANAAPAAESTAAVEAGVVTPPVEDLPQVVHGSLPVEVIQRVVRQRSKQLRACYETGLKADPDLQGRVVTKFLIDRTGKVSGVLDDRRSDLPDLGVRKCVQTVFSHLTFPPPEGGGEVTAVYPLSFAHGELPTSSSGPVHYGTPT